MPIIEVKAFEERFKDDDQAALLIEKLTSAFADVYGPEVAAEVEVVLTGVRRTHWGFGGTRRV